MPYQPSLPGLFAPCAPARVSNLFDTLLHYPDISAELTCARAKELGQSAELLTDSLLARLGIPCANFAEHSPFDRMIWIGSACLRLQIKSRHKTGEGGYRFDIKKGYQRGPHGTRPYSRDEFDLLALVALPENVVKFTSVWSTSHVIRPDEIPGLRARPGRSLVLALEALGIFIGGAEPTSG